MIRFFCALLIPINLSYGLRSPNYEDVKMAETELSEDERLVSLAKQGDRKAFSKLMRQHMNKILALTYRMTGDRDSSMDLTQETFLTAWEKIASFRGDSSFSSWLFRIASNKSLNFLKSSNRQKSDETVSRIKSDLIDSQPVDPHTELVSKELKDRVLGFMKRLPSQQRLAFELRFYKQLKFTEIAAVTGNALGTVKTNYREAIKKLRQFAGDGELF